MATMMFRGVRGATIAEENTDVSILEATRELLQSMIEVNQIEEDYVASIIFTSTPDLNAAFPAKAARDIGWNQVALLGCQEVNVPGGLPRCIRILIHWNTEKRNDELIHVYLRDSVKLRPDLFYPPNKITSNHPEESQPISNA